MGRTTVRGKMKFLVALMTKTAKHCPGVVNSSFQNGGFLEILKLAKVTSLFKKVKRNSQGFRESYGQPIELLSRNSKPAVRLYSWAFDTARVPIKIRDVLKNI